MHRSERVVMRLTSWTGLAPLMAGSLLLFLALSESRAQPPRDAETNRVRGRIERFTTAPMGEVDGAVLEDGTQLHWPPHLQDRFTRILKNGDQVRATGRTETGPAGDTHFEIQSVTNLRTNTQAENPDLAAAPPRARPAGRGRSADREQRLRELEDQVQQLLQEIQRLRREK